MESSCQNTALPTHLIQVYNRSRPVIPCPNTQGAVCFHHPLLCLDVHLLSHPRAQRFPFSPFLPYAIYSRTKGLAG